MNQHENPNNQIASIRPDYITEDYLKLMGLKLSDFEGKNIASIGGGFGMLEMDLAKTGKTKVVIVDPIYNNKKSIILEEIQKQITGLREVENKRSNTITLLTQQNIAECLSNIQKQRVYLNEFQDNYKYDKLPMNLTLNPSSGENIKGIKPNSQDYVFINNVLFHFPKEINKFLSEADKILKPGGTIFIIDYTNELKNLQEYFKSNGTYKINDENKRRHGAFYGSLKKGEYKQVEKFLEKRKDKGPGKYVI